MGKIVKETFWKLFAQSRERKNRFTEKILKTEKNIHVSADADRISIKRSRIVFITLE